MTLRVLTFNTWGVPVFSRDRAARMRAIGRALATLDVDVVGLQEVFRAKDRSVIARGAAENGLTFSHYFASGLMGSGLFTLSRYPIVETSFLRFRLNGRPQDLVRGDYYAGKGVGRARVRCPDGALDVYNAHFIAPYLEFGPDRFAAHRVAQALETSRYIRTQSGAVPAILTCDLNCYQDDLTYRTIVAGGLTETHSAANPDADATRPAHRSGYATIHPPARFDYVFARSAASGTLTVKGSKIVFGGAPIPNPDQLVGYSDHYGVLSDLEMALPEVETPDPGLADSSLASAINWFLGGGIRRNGLQRRQAGFAAAAAGVASAALLRPPLGRNSGLSGRTLVTSIVAALLVAGGVNLSTAARLGSETQTLNTLLSDVHRQNNTAAGQS